MDDWAYMAVDKTWKKIDLFLAFDYLYNSF